jgi:fructosamine-3-kinase
MFEGEKAGLLAILATKTLRCPKPLKIVKQGSSVALVMESLNMSSLSKNQEELLGEQLARLLVINQNR